MIYIYKAIFNTLNSLLIPIFFMYPRGNIFMFVQDQTEMRGGGGEGGVVVTKNEMDNPRFVDEETIPLV